MTSISIIIATQGRPTLGRAVESILPQLVDDDEVLLIGDNFMPECAGCRCIADYDSRPSQYGNRQRNRGMLLAHGDVICFLDDDDWHLPGSLDAIRKASLTVPMMFRAVLPHGKTVWRRPIVKRGNIGTCTVVVPNARGKLPQWQVSPDQPRGTDSIFCREAVERFGGVEWNETVVYQCGGK